MKIIRKNNTKNSIFPDIKASLQKPVNYFPYAT